MTGKIPVPRLEVRDDVQFSQPEFFEAALVTGQNQIG
jgi:hypothetical protein